MNSDAGDFTFKEFVVNADSSYSDADIFKMYNEDPSYSSKMSVRKISLLTGRSIGEIYRVLERFGGGPVRQGRNYHLVSAYAAMGLTPKEIAERSGYTERGVRNILNRMENANYSN